MSEGVRDSDSDSKATRLAWKREVDDGMAGIRFDTSPVRRSEQGLEYL